MWAKMRKTVADHGPLFSSVSALIAILVSAGGILFSQGTRDRLVTLLGGATQAELSAFRSAMIAERPDYLFNLFSGMTKEDCLAALKGAAETIHLDHGESDGIAYSRLSTGILFELKKDGQVIGSGGVDCHAVPLSAAPGDLLDIVVLAVDAQPSEEREKAFAALKANFFDSLTEHLPEGAAKGIPRPFLAELDPFGRLILPETYHGLDIVPAGISDLDPLTLRDMFKDDRAPAIADIVRLIREDAGISP